MAALPPEHRALIGAGVLASRWYPVEAFVSLAEVAQRLFAPADPGFYRESGRHNAEYGLSGVHRVMLRDGGPLNVLKGSEALWVESCDAGRVDVKPQGEHRAVLRVHGVSVALLLCERTTGYSERAVELAGGRDVAVRKTRCSLRDDPHCEWEISWS